MKVVVTGDKSTTFFNEKFQEHYHSTSGAAEEAIKKFVEPTNIRELAKAGTIKILDICFGLGYNTAAALDAIWEVNKDCKVEVIGLESDEDLFESLIHHEAPFKSYYLVRKLASNEILDLLDQNITISILGGDARDSIKSLSSNSQILQTFDIVFLDPFSPKKCPELWTKEFFTEIKKLMKNGAYLTTYSCASSVRKNLQELNFKVRDGPIVGRRSPSTVAVNK